MLASEIPDTGPNYRRGMIAASPVESRIVYGVLIALTLVATTIILYAMGRSGICKCGTVKLWHGVVQSSESSQHITDWYTLSHVVHGFLFYCATWLIARMSGWQIPFLAALAAAVSVEAIWEVFENSDFIINRYRQATISLDYYGDSVINSLSDIAAMMLGFIAARHLPSIITIFTALALEVFAAAMIRDNLLLNIVMLLHPLDAIRVWQKGG